jgi:hypothetical protein
MMIAKFSLSLAVLGALAACGPAEVGIWAVNAALRPSGHSPEMCEYNPVRAYIERHNCKDATGQLLPSPITSANVNTVFEGTCVLQMARQRDRMDVFQDAWAMGANPDTCEALSFYSFLLGDCRNNPVVTQRYIDASKKAGWFTRADQAQQLLEPGIVGSCVTSIEWALANGAKVAQKMSNPAYKGQTFLYFAYGHYARDYWYRNESAQKTFRALIKSGGCAKDLDLPTVNPEAASVLDGIRREVCGS